MKSITKFRIQRAVLEQIYKHHFGRKCRIGEVMELTDGMYNASYKLEIREPDYRYVVLKIGPPSHVDVLTYEKNIMKTEVHVYETLKGSNVPVPDLIAYDFGHTIIPCDYMFMSCLDGTPLNKVRKKRALPMDSIKKNWGAYAKEIHQHLGEKFGYPGNSDLQGSKWSIAFYRMVKAILRDGTYLNVRFPFEVEALLAVIEQKAAELDEVSEARLVHFDLWEGNLFIEESGSDARIEAIIDGERAFYGDPLCELVSSVSLFGDIYLEVDFFEGLGMVEHGIVQLGKKEKSRVEMYRLYLYLLMYVEIFYRKNGGFFYKKFMYAKLKKQYAIVRREEK